MAIGPEAPVPPSRGQALLAHVMFSARTAAEAVGTNKLRAGLTSLGILFGVVSVIAMLAIGNASEHPVRRGSPCSAGCDAPTRHRTECRAT